MLPGNYKIRELEAPLGYQLSDEVIDASLNLDSVTNTLSDLVIAQPMTNKPIIGSITLQKVNQDNVPLMGAQFGLYNKAGELIQTVTSNSEGIVLFNDVNYGEYTIKELIAPDGYTLSDKVITVIVTDSGIIKTDPYEFINNSKVIISTDKPTGSPPVTGNPDEVTVPLAFGSILLIAGILLLFINRYKKSNNI